MNKMKDKLAASVRHARDTQAATPKVAAKPVAKSAATPAKPSAAKAVPAPAKPSAAKPAQATDTYSGGIADSRNQLFPARVWPD